MRSDLYTKSGMPLGFHDRHFIYDLHGRIVGQLHGSHVYCMAGHYVGEIEDGVIHENRRNHGRIGACGTNSKVPLGRGHQRKS